MVSVVVIKVSSDVVIKSISVKLWTNVIGVVSGVASLIFDGIFGMVSEIVTGKASDVVTASVGSVEISDVEIGTVPSFFMVTSDVVIGIISIVVAMTSDVIVGKLLVVVVDGTSYSFAFVPIEVSDDVFGEVSGVVTTSFDLGTV